MSESDQAAPIAPSAERFPVPRSVIARLHSDPQADIDAAAADPDAFWLAQARKLEWTREPTQGLSGQAPDFQWFADGETNVTLSALDRHARGEARTRAAFIWLSGTGEEQVLTYQKGRSASALRHGV